MNMLLNSAATSHKCKLCGCEKPIEDFELTPRNRKVYIRNFCKKCRRKRSYQQEKLDGRYEKRKARNRLQRHNPKHRPRFILQDSRAYDQSHGLDNDVDREFIAKLIQHGCSYCGESKIKIGLDRINNSIGHIRSNVVAACIRCNFIRRTMPYEAWLLIVPGIREATEKGLLKDWNGYGFNRHAAAQNYLS